MAEIIDNYILSTIKGSERKKYATTHGINSLINAYHGLPWNDREAERVYKICNEKGITWEQYYGKTVNNVLY